MPIMVSCPSCEADLRVKDELAGRRVKCPKCGNAFTIPQGAGGVQMRSMTEAEWLACNDPREMLDFLRGQASDRKLRLFAVACCRTVWPLLVEEEVRRAIELSEKFADSQATQQDRAIELSEKFADSQATQQEVMRAAAVVRDMKMKDFAASWVGASTRD